MSARQVIPGIEDECACPFDFPPDDPEATSHAVTCVECGETFGINDCIHDGNTTTTCLYCGRVQDNPVGRR